MGLFGGQSTNDRLGVLISVLLLWLRHELVIADVHGRSMEPTLTDGDHLLCARGAARRIGTIVVRDTGHRDSIRRYQIKRLVASAGDMRGGLLIEAGYCWIEGDNTAASGDSRTFGPVVCTELMAVGVAVLRSGRVRGLLTRNSAEVDSASSL